MNVGAIMEAALNSPRDFDYDRLKRWSSLARTWTGKSARLIQRDAEQGNEHVRVLVGYEAAWTLAAILDDAELFVPWILEGYELEEAEKRAKNLASALRRRRLSMKLTNVEGRTPEEAAAFQEKARTL